MVKRHRSARGEQVDFDLLQSQNKNVIAIGNARMNANGDVLGSGGKIIRKVEDIPQENVADPNAAYNQANPKSTKMVSLKDDIDDDFITQQEVTQETQQKTEKTSTILEEKTKTKRKLVDSEE